MKNSQVSNKHKNKYVKLKTILSIWYFKQNRLPDGILMKHKSRLFVHGVLKQWGTYYWETYSPVLNLISVSPLLVIAVIHEFLNRSIDFLPAFTQAEIDVSVFLDILLGMGVDVNIGEWFLKF